jgi:diaminohydroxyphosphoribosylaminopyrimidine deaminase/5-amino-6-(5-phosphoribosylamino)uracil reductase
VSARAVTPDDLRFMDVALSLAYQALGSTAPNPAVGCVIVKNGRILGAAATAKGGRPHAEPQALEQAGAAAAGATAYVTLEPCAHHGVTPPCADTLVKAKVGEVVIACLDPFHKVNGRGVDILSAAGVPVLTGIREKEAERLNAGFFSLLRTGAPILETDPRPALYDADLPAGAEQDLTAALQAAGQAGLTRLRRV